MKHKKKVREVNRTMRVEHGYLYRSMTDEKPREGSIMFPINDHQRGVYFVANGGSVMNALKVADEEGCVSHDGMVWFYYRASKRELQTAYSEYSKTYSSSMRNASLTKRVTSHDYGLGNV